MSHGTAWGDGHPTFPGGWLDSVSLGTVPDHQWRLNEPVVSPRPTALLIDSVTVIVTGIGWWKDRRGSYHQSRRLRRTSSLLEISNVGPGYGHVRRVM